MWQVIESAATFVQGIIYFWFLSRLLDSKYDRRTTDILVIVMAVINVLVDACLSKVLGKNSIFMFMGIAFLYVILNFKNTIWDKISSFIAIEMIVAFVSQFLMYTFAFLFHMQPVELTKQEGGVRATILIIGQILCWVIAIGILYWSKWWGGVWKDRKVLIVSSFSIMVIWGLRQLMYLSETEPVYRRIIVVFIGILCVNILVLYIVWKFYCHEEALRRYKIQVKNAEEVYQVNEESRKIRHDMRNILLAAIGYLENGRPEKALQYLRTIQEEKLQIEQPIVCENEELSYLLTVKRQKCKEAGISFHYVISTNLSGISGIDLSILLGNLLDNAIEGAGKSREKKIDLQLQEQHGYYKITVQNSVDRTVLGNNRQLFTTKENTYEHGLGIKSVRAVVDKYNGICEFSEEEGLFTAEVLLPIEKE